MQLFIDDLRFASDPSKYNLDGELYFSIGESFFPSGKWFDMVGFDLKNWIPDLISFGLNHSDACFLSFMDGPYMMKLIRLDDGTILANGLRDSMPVISQQMVDLTQLIHSVITCCQEYDRFLYENGIPNQFTHEIRVLKTIIDT